MKSARKVISLKTGVIDVHAQDQGFVSHNVFLKSFCRSQLPHKRSRAGCMHVLRVPVARVSRFLLSRSSQTRSVNPTIFLEDATVRGRDWYERLDAPVLNVDAPVLILDAPVLIVDAPVLTVDVTSGWLKRRTRSSSTATCSARSLSP